MTDDADRASRPAPWLSILVPTYNGRSFIEHALESIETQGRDVAEIEILAVDDGSIDGTRELLADFEGRLPLRVLAGPRTGNWVANTNRALSEARGEFVGFLHQDDSWLPGRLVALQRLLDTDREAVMALHAVWFVDAAGWRLGRWRCPLPSGTSIDGDFLRERLAIQNFIALPAPVVRRDAALAVGGLDESLWYAADWDFWLKISARGTAVYSDLPLACFRVHGLSLTMAAAARPGEMREQLEAVLARHLPNVSGVRRDEIARLARLSVDANCLLAARGGTRRGEWGALLRGAAGLPPSALRTFFRNTRLAERVRARIVGLLGTSRGPRIDRGGRLSESLGRRPGAPLPPAEPASGALAPAPDPPGGRATGRTPPVTVVLPCLNEAGSVGACVRAAWRGLERLGRGGEVLVVDNGSADGSREEAARAGARVVEARERGYGNAICAGLAAAAGQDVVIADADGSYDLSELGAVLAPLESDADLVVGCRLSSGGGGAEPGAMSLPNRRLWIPLLSGVGRLFFKTGLHDVVCGFRAFRRDAVEGLALRTAGSEFASEMAIKAALQGLRLAEVPVAFHKRHRGRHVGSGRSGWRHLRFMLLLSPRWLFLVPGLLGLLVGLGLGGRLLAGPLRLGELVLDTNSLLVCSMSVIVGLQLCLFAVFTEIFSVTEGILPPSPGYPVLFRFATLERGLVAGATLVLFGLVLLLRATQLWRSAGFGGISYAESLRLVIPAVTSLTVGTQLIFSSFFLSTLGLRRR